MGDTIEVPRTVVISVLALLQENKADNCLAYILLNNLLKKNETRS